MNPHWSLTHNAKFVRERSDLLVECLTRDRRVTGLSLTCGTAAVCVLEQDTLISSKYCFNPGRPTWHDLKTQRINLNKQISFNTYATEDWNNIYDSFHCKIKLPFLLLDLTVARCSGLQVLSRLFRVHRRVLDWIVSEISIFSEPAQIYYRRAFNSLKHKKSIHNFIKSGPTDQNAYCSDICNT